MQKFALVVVSPEGKLYDGEAESVHVPGKTGGMTVLARHAPLLAALSKGRVSITGGSGPGEFDIEKGFIEVNEKRVDLFVRKA